VAILPKTKEETMSEDKRYNGWANYETWAVNLWIDNCQGTQEYWNERAQEALQRAFDGEGNEFIWAFARPGSTATAIHVVRA
jgi:hypothetical protein